MANDNARRVVPIDTDLVHSAIVGARATSRPWCGGGNTICKRSRASQE